MMDRCRHIFLYKQNVRFCVLLLTGYLIMSERCRACNKLRLYIFKNVVYLNLVYLYKLYIRVSHAYMISGIFSQDIKLQYSLGIYDTIHSNHIIFGRCPARDIVSIICLYCNRKTLKRSYLCIYKCTYKYLSRRLFEETLLEQGYE